MLQRFGANYTVRLVPSQEMAQIEMPTNGEFDLYQYL